MKDRSQLLNVREQRVGLSAEIRDADTAGTLTFTGYAALFDTPYNVYGGPDDGGWVETLDRRAFQRTLNAKPDVVFLINHDGMPLARTTSGTMNLRTDSKGLFVEASLDPVNPRVIELSSAMRRGDMSQMSFAFRTKQQVWNEDYTERRIVEASLDHGDVSSVNTGANTKTTSSLRAMFDELVNNDELLQELRADREQLMVLHKKLGMLLQPAESRNGLSIVAAERLMLLDV
jgi:HK97 family phage prohead protease